MGATRLAAIALSVAALVAAPTIEAAATQAPAVEAQQLAAAQQKLAAAELAATEKVKALQKQLNRPDACRSASQIPKSKQAAAFGIIFSYLVVTTAEQVAPAFVSHAHDVAALHLTDPPLARYGAAAQAMATLVAPLQSAKPVGVCTVLARWIAGGYPTSSAKWAALFGLTLIQGQATDIANDANPVVKAFAKAKAAADIRMRALGVTPVALPPKSP